MFLVDLLNRGYKAEFYTPLKEEMFESEVDRKVLRALKQGYKYSMSDLTELRKVAGLGYTEMADLMTDASSSNTWLTESDVLEFIRDFQEKQAKLYYDKGDIREAIKVLEENTFAQTNVIEDYIKHLEECREKADVGYLGLPTGIFKLDEATSGMRPGKIWIVGGYNAYGKTYFMTNMINKVLSLGRRACVLTLEMSKEDIIDRLIGEKLELGVYELAKTINQDAVAEQVTRVKGFIDKGNLSIIDSLYELDEIKTKLRVENSNRKIDVLFIDFVQLIGDKKSKSSYEALKSITTTIQALTKELGCCTMLLSQISNEAQKDGSNSTYGFKGAGEIGQIADVAIRIVRKENETGEMTDDYILDVVKNRTGRGGTIDCKIKFPGGHISEAAPVFDEERMNKESALDSLFGL